MTLVCGGFLFGSEWISLPGSGAMELLVRKVTLDNGTALFRWFAHPRAEALHAHLARTAVLVRRFPTTPDNPLPSLRIGLPADATQLARLSRVLESFR